jgi:ABC-type Zn uptake system ZnuABC Zn-binding protein ZnuA
VALPEDEQAEKERRISNIKTIVSAFTILASFAAQLVAAASQVSGIFKGNDQPANLAFVSAHMARR